MSFPLKVLQEADRIANLIWFSGRNETISATLGRKVAEGTAHPLERLICDALSKFDPDHCLKAFERTLAGKADAPPCECAPGEELDVQETWLEDCDEPEPPCKLHGLVECFVCAVEIHGEAEEVL